MFQSVLNFFRKNIKPYYNMLIIACHSLMMGVYLFLNQNFFQSYTFHYILGDHDEITFIIALGSIILSVLLLVFIALKNNKLIRASAIALAGFWLGVSAVFLAARPPGSYWIFALLAFFAIIGNIRRETTTYE